MQTEGDASNTQPLPPIHSRYPDSNLLEYAAKAVGCELEWHVTKLWCWLNKPLEGYVDINRPWNPIKSFADSQLLALPCGCIHNIGEAMKLIYPELKLKQHTLETIQRSIVVYAELQGGIQDDK